MYLTMEAFSNIPHQVGTLVADLDGRVLSSSGELSQAADTARALRAMLMDAAKVKGERDGREGERGR